VRQIRDLASPRPPLLTIELDLLDVGIAITDRVRGAAALAFVLEAHSILSISSPLPVVLIDGWQ
jgi:hypothetical protein